LGRRTGRGDAMAFGDVVIVIACPDMKSAGAALHQGEHQTASEDAGVGSI